MIMDSIRWINKQLLTLNLFESDTIDIETIRRERFSTRIYLFLMVIILIALIIYTGMTVHTKMISVAHPRYNQFEYLYEQYGTTLRCPCSKVAIPYETFVQVKIIFHQVCSSSFISSQWIQSIYAANVTYIWPMDIRTTLSAFWQLVAAFCQNLQNIVTKAMVDYNVSTLISPQEISVVELKARAETFLNFTLTTVQTVFKRNLLIIRRMTSANQLISGLGTNAYLQFFEVNTELELSANPVINTYDNCSCAKIDGCLKLSGFFEFNMWNTKGIYNGINANITIPGLLFDCYLVDATLASTLECYYKSACLTLIHPTLNITPMSQISSRQFHMNTTIQALIDQLLIEQIQIETSFIDYHLQCNPSLCTYIDSHRFDLVFMLTTVVSVFGGLVVIVKLIALLIVKVALALQHRCSNDSWICSTCFF